MRIFSVGDYIKLEILGDSFIYKVIEDDNILSHYYLQPIGITTNHSLNIHLSVDFIEKHGTKITKDELIMELL